MWPFKRAPVAEAPPLGVIERLDNLEDSINHFNRRFARLQQQVTRWAQEYDDELDEPEDEFNELLEVKRRNHG